MAVIALPSIQPQGSAVTDDWELRSITALNRSPLNGVATTLERPGAHWAVTPRFHNLNGSNRARMQQHLANCRGHASRMYVPLYGWTRRGSFAAPELLTNNTFASGTTGWTTGGLVMTAADGLLRQTRNAHSNTIDMASFGTVSTVTQYAPYAARCIDHQGSSTLFSSGPQLGSVSGGEEYGKANSIAFGLKTLVSVLPATSAWFGLVDYDTGANMAGDYIEHSYTSFARCALVDNGPNTLLRSDELENASWPRVGLSAVTTAETAPDGTNTAEALVENSSLSQHNISQSVTVSSAAADYALTVAVKGNGRNFVFLQLVEGTGATDSYQIFNLGTGAVGATGANGANWSNRRTFITPLGNSWYLCSIVARKTNAATMVTAWIQISNADSVASYTGDGVSGIRAWRATLAQSSVPTRLSQTTTAATTGTLQTGSALYLKGLPASTNGLLLQGDPVEIITNTSSQLVRTRAPLNSDAAGLGYLQFEAPLRISPLDNAAVIVCNPLCRMMLDDNTVRWSEHDGTFTDLEFTAVEDTYP